MASLIEYRKQLAERDLSMAWPQWRIIRLLGAGAFGEVYEIHREEYGRVSRCALKVIRKENAEALPGDSYHNASRGNASDEFITTVLKEIDIMEKLKGAPNIVVIDDYTVVRNPDSSAVLIRMELLTNLGEFMSTRQVTMNDILKIGIDICTALDYCEHMNIIHRDVKESNIFFSDQGDFKLGDFGISKQLNNYLMNNGTMTAAGTVSKMAPEVYHGERYDNTVDIYSLGIVLYSLLNYGRSPFYPPYPEAVSAEASYMADMQRLKGTAIPPLAGVDKKLNGIILKACSPKPSSRYRTAEEFKRALQAYYAEINNLQWSEPYQVPGGNRKYVYAAAIIAAIAITVGSVSFWYLGRRNASDPGGSGNYAAERESSGYTPGEPVKPQDVVVTVPTNSLGDYLGTGDEKADSAPDDTNALNDGAGDPSGREDTEPEDATADAPSGGGGHVTDAGNLQNIGDRPEGSADTETGDQDDDPEEDGAVFLVDKDGRKVVRIEEPDWSTYEWVADDKEAADFRGGARALWVQYFDGSAVSPSSRADTMRSYYISDPENLEVESVSDVSESSINGMQVSWVKAKYRYIKEDGTLSFYYEMFTAFASGSDGLLEIELYTVSEEGYIENNVSDFEEAAGLITILK